MSRSGRGGFEPPTPLNLGDDKQPTTSQPGLNTTSEAASWQAAMFVPEAPAAASKQTTTTNKNSVPIQPPPFLSPAPQTAPPLLDGPTKQQDTSWHTQMFLPGVLENGDSSSNNNNSPRQTATVDKKAEKAKRRENETPEERIARKERKAKKKERKEISPSRTATLKQDKLDSPKPEATTAIPPVTPTFPLAIDKRQIQSTTTASAAIDPESSFGLAMAKLALLSTANDKSIDNTAPETHTTTALQLAATLIDRRAPPNKKNSKTHQSETSPPPPPPEPEAMFKQESAIQFATELPQSNAAMDAFLSGGSNIAVISQTIKSMSFTSRRGNHDKAHSTGSLLGGGGDSKRQSLSPKSRGVSSPQMHPNEKTTAPPTARDDTSTQLGYSTKAMMIPQGSKSILREPSSHEFKVEKKTKGKPRIGWTTQVFVAGGNDPTSSSGPNLNSEERNNTDDGDRRNQMSSSKSMRIDNKEKRDMRWQWNQLLISKTFTPYKKMLAKDDDLLPDDDDFNTFEDREDPMQEKYDIVRDSMLDNGDLTEREIASFFEGFSLFAVKVRSLESQLDSLKAANREASRDFAMRSLRGSSMLSQSMGSGISGPRNSLKRAHSGRREALLSAHKSVIVDDGPKSMGMVTTPVPFAQKSLRAMSIRKIQTEHKGDEKIQKLLAELEEAEKKQKKLEKQLQQAGISIAEDIPYEEAKAEVTRIAKRMGEIGSADVKHEDQNEQARLRQEYFTLEQAMEKYNTALTLTDEWIEEQEEMEQKWEDDNAPENEEALKKLRRHIPVNVKSLSEAQLSSDLTPNGKVLPKEIAKKLKRTNVLQLIRTNPEDLVRVHPSTLENLRVTGLTLTERRALYAHLLPVGPRWKAMQGDQMTERKWNWYKTMKLNFKENLDSYLRHVAQYGPPGSHPYASRQNPNEGCPLIGKQCPLKADKLIDYDNDYGYTDEAEYEVSSVRKADTEDPGAKAMREAAEFAREKTAGARSDLLKKHYKGKVLQVSLANGSCENMDEALDKIDTWQTKWIEERVAHGDTITDAVSRKEMTGFSEALNELKLSVLQFAERSGMQLTGKKDANADQPDIRSPVELGLSEDLCESADDFFNVIVERMDELKVKDGRMNSTIDQLRELLVELHERNLSTLKDLGVDRPEGRKRKTRKEIEADAKAKLQPKEDTTPVENLTHDRPPGGPGRGGLMDAIAGRGRGGAPARGGLMDAIAGRGRGGDAGREGLMDAIAGRGRGAAPGRGGLMDAIAGRGRGADAGRGGLMDAIARRGRGGDAGREGLMDAIAERGRGAAPGRGGLMDAIAGRGRGADAGRGGLMDAIAGRGRVGDAGRGGLMAAIAARGAGRGNARDTGGGDLMSAIKARGGAGRGAGRGNARDAGRGDFLAMIQARGRGRGSFGSERAIITQGEVEVPPPSPTSQTPSVDIGPERNAPGRMDMMAELRARQVRKAAAAASPEV